jgi:hypothetical protein
VPLAAEIRTPFTRAPWQAGGLPDTWRKKVLPVGEVSYKGRMLKFTPEYLRDLAVAYSDGAYEQVPFQLADAANTHTNDPERYRGEVTGVEVARDGLYMTVKTTPAGSKLLATNPKLGVSARIVEGYDRSDGKFYPAAVQHVLGTLDPRIPNLGAWEAVEMSSTPEQVVDLSNLAFAGEDGGMPDLDADQQGRLARLLELDPDKLNALIAGLEDDGGGDDESGGMTDDDLAQLITDMDDAEFGALLAEYEIAPQPQPALAGAGLANQYATGELELTNYRIAETERQMAVVQAELDAQRFKNEKRQLMGAGVPGYICDLAQPLLEGAGHVVELSNGSGIDAGRLMRTVLTEFGRATAMLDLSGELGTAMDEPDTGETAASARQDFVANYRRVVGI